MNKILNRNLNKVTKETVYIIQKDWKDGGEKIVAEVYVDKNLSLSQKIDKAFMLTNSIENAWWKNDDVHALYNSRSTSVKIRSSAPRTKRGKFVTKDVSLLSVKSCIACLSCAYVNDMLPAHYTIVMSPTMLP